MMQQIKKTGLLCAFAFLISFSHAQNPPYEMGILPGPDSLYDSIPLKATLTRELYRDVGIRASLKQYSPTPGSQGQYGTCVAWSCGYCARTIVESVRNNWTDKARINANAFSAGFIYRVTEPNRWNCGGAFPSEMLFNLQNVGIPKLADYNFLCPQNPIPQQIYSLASPNRIQGFTRLWDEGVLATSKEKISLMKKSLSEKNPVVIAMICPNSFFYVPSSGLWTPTESPEDVPGHMHGRHSICVVGYDDEKFGGAFEVQNSWGTDWGNGGYAWIKYSDFISFVYQAFEMLKFPIVEPVNVETHLAGTIRFVTSDNSEMAATWRNGVYSMNEPYRSGTRFRIYLTSEHPAYVYTFSADNSFQVTNIFPFQPGVSPALTYSENEVAIPDEDHQIRFDGAAGTESVCMIFSRKPIQIAEFERKFKSGTGSFTERVNAIVGASAMLESEMQFRGDGRIGFSGVSKERGVAVLFLSIKHVE